MYWQNAGPTKEPRVHYKKTQWGWITLIATLPALIILLWLATRGDHSTLLRVIVGCVAGVLLLCAFVFRSMTVTVDDETITVALGSGWPRMRIPLAEVSNVSTARPHWLAGYGIRWTRDGWLWRISGRDAVRVERAGKRAFLIGSGDADALCEVIREVIGPQINEPVQ